MTLRTDVDADELVEFLLDEHAKGTGIPVHPFSVVNADIKLYDGTFGITNGLGTLFVEDGYLTAYGYNNDFGAMLTALRRCGVETKFLN